MPDLSRFDKQHPGVVGVLPVTDGAGQEYVDPRRRMPAFEPRVLLPASKSTK